MSGQLKNLRVVDPVLTEIAYGINNAEFIGTQIFPVVNVSKEGGKIPIFNSEAFKQYKTERAIRAASNQINPDKRNDVSYQLTEHDLSYPIDYREDDEDMFDTELHATDVTVSGIQLRLENMIANMIQDSSSYDSSNVVTLTPGDGFNEDSSNPFAIIDAGKNQIRSKIAKRPNMCVMGPTTFNALKNHPKIVDRIKYTQYGVVTEQLLATLFGFDKVLIGDAINISDAEVESDVYSDNMILFYSPGVGATGKHSVYKPAFGYTIKKKSWPQVDKYDVQKKVEFVRATDIFEPKLLGKDAGYLIKNCVI